MRPATEVGRRSELVRSRRGEPGGDEATDARNVVVLHAAHKFGDAQGPPLGDSEPQQLLADTATTELATNVDRDSCSFTIDLNVDETDGLAVQHADPSVADRVLLYERPPLKAGSVEVGVEASCPSSSSVNQPATSAASSLVSGLSATDRAGDLTDTDCLLRAPSGRSASAPDRSLRRG
jgi:hypothetical protein